MLLTDAWVPLLQLIFQTQNLDTGHCSIRMRGSIPALKEELHSLP